MEILRDLRLGVYDVVVGINLLREGLDLPEVSLVAILDADKEGYLRSTTSLIQTMGRAARHVDGQGAALRRHDDRRACRWPSTETDRRRAIQEAHNEAHGITPQGIRKAIRDLGERLKAVAETRAGYEAGQPIPKEDVARLVKDLERQMKEAARSMEFERAALLRDQIYELRATLSDADTPDTALAPVSRRGATAAPGRRHRRPVGRGRRAAALPAPRAALHATAAGAGANPQHPYGARSPVAARLSRAAPPSASSARPPAPPSQGVDGRCTIPGPWHVSERPAPSSPSEDKP